MAPPRTGYDFVQSRGGLIQDTSPLGRLSGFIQSLFDESAKKQAAARENAMFPEQSRTLAGTGQAMEEYARASGVDPWNFAGAMGGKMPPPKGPADIQSAFRSPSGEVFHTGAVHDINNLPKMYQDSPFLDSLVSGHANDTRFWSKDEIAAGHKGHPYPVPTVNEVDDLLYRGEPPVIDDLVDRGQPSELIDLYDPQSPYFWKMKEAQYSQPYKPLQMLEEGFAPSEIDDLLTDFLGKTDSTTGPLDPSAFKSTIIPGSLPPANQPYKPQPRK